MNPSFKVMIDKLDYGDATSLRGMIQAASRRHMERTGMLTASTTPATSLAFSAIEVIGCNATRDMFMQAAREFCCEESAMFIHAVQTFMKHKRQHGPGSTDVEDELNQLARQFIKPGGMYEVALPMKLRYQILNDLRLHEEGRQPWRLVWLPFHGHRTRLVKVHTMHFLHSVSEGREDGKGIEEGLQPSKSPMVPMGTGVDYAKVELHLQAAMVVLEDCLNRTVRGHLIITILMCDSTQQEQVNDIPPLIDLYGWAHLIPSLIQVLPLLQKNEDFRVLCATAAMDVSSVNSSANRSTSESLDDVLELSAGDGLSSHPTAILYGLT